MLNEFNEGGTHDQNPLGGIPQGIGNNGEMNTVEQGETKKDSFIYSNRITLTPQVVVQFNLPKSLSGKTAADATKLINNKFEGRNSKIDNNTKKAFLDRIAEAQETIKAEEQAKIQEAMQINSTEVPDMMEGQVPQGMEEFTQQPMAYGGRLKQNQMFMGGDQMNQDPNQMNQGQNGGMGMSGLGSMFSGMGNTMNTYAQQRDASKNPEGYVDEKGLQDSQNNQMIDSTKDSIAKATGPFGQLFRGIQKAGQGVGNAVGGETGAAVSGMFSPEEGTMSAMTNKDLSIGEKALATIPGVGGVMAKRAADKRLNEFKFKRDTYENNAKISNFALGGDLGDPKKQALGDIATKKDTMFVQKYSQDKKKELLNKGYVKQRGFKKDGGYDNVHDLNDNARKMLQEDWNNGKRRDIVDLNNNRLSKPFDPNFYQKQHETNPNVYYNLEGANALGVINPNTNYLAFDRRINPNVKSEWINPKTGDGVEFYEYDFGSKYNTPNNANKTKTISKNPAISQAKKISTNPNVSRKPLITPNQISPVSSGYKFAMGGNMYEGGGPFDKSSASYDPTKINLGLPQQQSNQLLDNLNYVKNLNSQGLITLSPEQLQENNGYSNPELAPENIKADYQSPYPKAKLGEKLNKVGQYAKDNYGNILRYAPVAMNAYQLAKMGKPEVERLDRLGNRYNPQYMDERALTNQINAETNYTANALANASNGSLGSLSNNILGMQLNKTKALSDAYSKIADVNRNENKTGQQFNLGVDQFNVGQSNMEKDINARNRGAFKTERSKLLGQIGNDLGQIGKEEVYKKMAKEAFNYTWDGKYVTDNKGKTVVDPETNEPMTKEKYEQITGKKTGKDYSKIFRTMNTDFGNLSLNNKNTKE